MALDLLLAGILIAGAVAGALLRAVRTRRLALAGLVGAIVAIVAWKLVSPGWPPFTHALAATFAGLAVGALGYGIARWVSRSAQNASTSRSRVVGGTCGAIAGVTAVVIFLPLISATQPPLVMSSTTLAAFPSSPENQLPTSSDVSQVASVAPETPEADRSTIPENTPADTPRRIIAWTRVEAGNGQRSQTYTGTVRATDRAQLAFEVTGDIAAIETKVGDTVKAGEVLARLDETPLRLAVAEREAGVAEAQAVLEEARADFRRQRRLLQRRVIAEARLERAQLSLSTAESRLKSAEAARKTAEDSLASAILRAPFDARVSAQFKEASEIAMAGSPILELEGLLSGRELVVNLPEEVVERVDIGNTFLLEGMDGTAVVAEIGSRASGGATFPVTLALKTQQPVLVGATRSVRVQYRAHDRDVLIVPLGAVAVGTGQAGTVFVYDKTTERVAARAVTIERYRRDGVEITGALASGDIIASRGAAFLNDGEPVDLLGVGVARFER